MPYVQADLAERIYNLTVERRDVCPHCRESMDTIRHNCSAMLRALGDYRDLSLFEHAPPAPDLPRPQIPPGRPGKRVHGFMSMREPLEDDRVPYHDEPRYGTTSASSGGATSSSYIPHHDECRYGTASASLGGAISSFYIPIPPSQTL